MGVFKRNHKSRQSSGHRALDKRAKTTLDRIAADLLALRPFSMLQAQLYAQIKAQQHKARLAALIDTAASLEDRRTADFAELQAIKGDAEGSDTEPSITVFEALEDEAKRAQD